MQTSTDADKAEQEFSGGKCALLIIKHMLFLKNPSRHQEATLDNFNLIIILQYSLSVETFRHAERLEQ